MSGYITYLEYTAGENKGATNRGDVLNSPFGLGDVDPNYTGATVVETVKENGKVAWMQNGKFGAFGILAEGEKKAFHEGYVEKAGEALLVAVADVVVGDNVSYIYNNIEIPQEKLPTLNAKMNGIPLLAHARRISIKRNVA